MKIKSITEDGRYKMENSNMIWDNTMFNETRYLADYMRGE